MKKITLIVFAIIFLATPLLSFGQEETKIKEKSESDQKCSISYTFINEYGLYAGGAIGFTGIFVNGIRFNKTQDVIGLGLGYEVDSRSTYSNYYENGYWHNKQSDSPQSIPIFVNYRHYFPGKRALKPLVNIGLGTRISFWKEWTGWNVPYYIDDVYMYDIWYSGNKEQQVRAGLYATMAAGFKVKVFSFTSGFFMKSMGKDFFGGVEVKVGITF